MIQNLLHGNELSLEDFFFNPFSSGVNSNYVSVHVYVLVQVLVEAQNNEQVLLLGSIIVSLTLCF